MLNGNAVVLFWTAGPVPSCGHYVSPLRATRWLFRCNDNICLSLLGSLEIEEL